mgnify:CR=1 FL=1
MENFVKYISFNRELKLVEFLLINSCDPINRGFKHKSKKFNYSQNFIFKGC